MFENVRAVAFDLDNTLWDIEPVISRAEARLLEWIRQNCPRMGDELTTEHMRTRRQQLALEEPAKAHDLTYLRVAALARHAREFGYDETVAERAFEVFFAARNELEMFDDVQPALERLRTRYALASLTNGNADLARIGIAESFSVSLNATQIGVAKPHPRCFEWLSRELRVPPAAILYVGDDPVLDVAAARAVGLLTAWMNRRGAQWPAGMDHPDLTVNDCLELAEVLTR